MEYSLDGNIAILHRDDGKANAVGHSFIDGINAGLDRAEGEAKAVLLRGREGVFSAGFDLSEFKKGPEATMALVKRGFELLHRLYSYPLPVVAACSGHGVALGAFILLASDTRVGADGDFRITLPETAISMDIPSLMMALVTSRVSPRHQTRAAIQAEVYSPRGAIEAGFLDEVVDASKLHERSMVIANQLAELPQEFYAKNKLGTRKEALATMQDFLTNTFGPTP
ncbi:MAG: crotonase/enoyl-CoA hydratase family protein [Pseudomonadota bacterium]